MTLFTFGYEGLSIESFIAHLKLAGIKTVVDVRELPLSRKPGFSKRALAENLRKSGIAYSHMPALGCPKPIRNRYRQDGNWPAYARAFEAYIKRQTEALAELVRVTETTVACLICFEADFTRCHRSMVARSAAQTRSMQVKHLAIKATTPDQSARAVA